MSEGAAPDVQEVLSRLASWLEGEQKYFASLDRDEASWKAEPFLSGEIEARECRPYRDWVHALDPAHLRVLAGRLEPSYPAADVERMVVDAVLRPMGVVPDSCAKVYRRTLERERRADG